MRNLSFPLVSALLFLSGHALLAQVPVINSQTTVPSTDEENPVTISIGDLDITDDDPPTDLTLNIKAGTGYTVIDATTIMPDEDVTGTITVTVTVSDIDDGESAEFDYQVNVDPVNDPPVITGQVDNNVDIDEESSLTIEISDLIIEDPDDTNFTLEIPDGTNYSVSGNQITPDPNFFGSLSINLNVNDGDSDSPPFDYQIEVLNVNDPPTLDNVSNLVLTENGPAGDAMLSGIGPGAANETSDVLVVTQSNTNPGLFSSVDITYTSQNPTGTITFTPAPNMSGDATVTVRVSDGEAFVERNFTVSIGEVNSPPTLAAIGNVAVNEDAPLQTVDLTGISPGPGESGSQSVMLTAESSDPSIIPDPVIDYTPGNTTAELEFQPVANRFTPAGSPVTITVTVTDDGSPQLNTVRTFEVTVNSIDDMPTLGPTMDIEIQEDAGQQVINLTGISAGPEENQTITITALAGNGQAYFLHPTVNYSSPDTEGSLTFQPLPDVSGSTTITVTVSDGAPPNLVRIINVTINPVNDPPTLNAIADVTVPENSLLQAVNFGGISDGSPNESQLTTVTVTNDNPGLFLAVLPVYIPGAASGSINITPNLNTSGSATFTVTVSDGVDTFSRQFVFTVTSTNDPPSFAVINDVEVDEDAGPQSVDITGVSAGPGETQDITFTAVSSNSTLIPNPTVSYTQGQTTATLNFTPAANLSGTTTITVTAEDEDGANFARDFVIDVTPVNDAPTIAAIADVNIAEDAAQSGIPLTGITSGPQENQALTVTATPANASLFEVFEVVYTSPANTGTINVKPMPNVTGSTTVEVTVQDNGSGTAPNVNTTTVNFTVNVTDVNDPPVIASQDVVSVNEDNNFVILIDHLTITDPDNPSGHTITVSPGTNYTRSGTTITPAANFNGDLTIPITVSDGTSSSPSFDFILTVNPVNDAPVIVGQDPIQVDEAEPFVLDLDLINVTDVDNVYPDDFTVTILSGDDYSVTGTTITPIPNFNGVLEVPVFVNDGAANSNTFVLDIQVDAVNDPPVIVSQSIALTIDEDQSVVLALGQLSVTDPDNVPADLTLIVQAGANYTFSGLTVTPNANFNGPLNVSVVVNDGTVNSAPFNMLVTVNPINDPPVIVDQNPVTTTEDTPITITLADLVVEDPDANDPYPGAFTMTASPGTNYTLSGLTVTPAADFTGTLSVPVVVNDGDVNSNTFNLQIQVTDENDVPEIIAQTPLPVVTEEDVPVTIQLSNLTVTDTDNTYPDDFSIVIQSGTNYTYSGATVTPALDFTGTLTVNVMVNDGLNNSAPFPFEISVVGENDPPQITGQKQLSVAEDMPITIQLTDLTVVDPDPEDVFPGDFTLTLLDGDNYTVDGATVQPAANYFGPLTVPVRVSDGVNNSAPFNLMITVNPVNDAPSLNPIDDVIIAENTEDYPVQITGISAGPLETQTVLVEATSSDNSLLNPDSDLQYDGSSTATLLLNPAPNKTGTVTITIRVIDPGLLAATQTFTVQIQNINDAPTLDPITFGPIPEDSPEQTVPLTGISAGPGESQVLTVTATADNPDVFETFEVVYTSPQTTGSLVFLPKPNAYGTAIVSVTVTDDGSNDGPNENFITRQFTLEITPVADPPVFLSEPVELALIGESYKYMIEVVDTDPGAVVTLDAAQAPGWLTLTETSNGKGSLTGTPPAGSSGSVLISLKATDDSDAEVFQNFTLIVDARPVVSNFAITVEEDVPKVIDKLRFDAAFQDDDNDVIQAVKITKLPPKGQLFVGSQAVNVNQEISAADLPNLSYKGLQDYADRDTIEWNASDGHAYATENAKIFITITPVNDPPVIVGLETDVLTVNAGEGPVEISTEFEVVDPDNEFLTRAEIGFRRQNFVAEEDLLVFEPTPKITGEYDEVAGILILTGTATVAEYNAAIRSIRYDNVSEVFSAEEVQKIVNYTVSDGQVLSVPRDRELKLIDTFEELTIPNGFTPNSDGDNDLWMITNLNRHVDASVRVYTMMGQIVYASDGLYGGWDGTYNGKLLPTDTYYYTIDLNLPFRKKVYKGAVTILR